jgi:NNP family nitrate/nitrite transporter-like MFS transporter
LPALAVCLFPPAFSALSRIVQPNMRSVAASLAPPLAFLLGGGVLPFWLGYMGERYTFALGIVLAGVAFLLSSFAALWLKLLQDDEMGEGC